ncbi:MAG: cupin domain-containing protein [Deltaproteobacteria bacterium]|nr:cupin domain-containing protein [Deltaproteobacteria bacterium]
MNTPEIVLQHMDWGGMTAEMGRACKDIDPSPLFKGLPEDRCQCPHWGYVLKGRLHYRYDGCDEVFKEGDVFYAPPGHLPFVESGCEYIEFSPTDTLRRTMEVVEKNMKS